MDRTERAAMQALVLELELLSDGEACDHAVGICWCATFRALEDAKSLLATQEERPLELVSDEQVSRLTDDLSAQIKQVVREVSEPAIRAEAPTDLPPGYAQRDFAGTVEKLSMAAPDLTEKFKLCKGWEQLAACVLDATGKIENTKMDKLIEIFMGRDN